MRGNEHEHHAAALGQALKKQEDDAQDGSVLAILASAGLRAVEATATAAAAAGSAAEAAATMRWQSAAAVNEEIKIGGSDANAARLPTPGVGRGVSRAVAATMTCRIVAARTDTAARITDTATPHLSLARNTRL